MYYYNFWPIFFIAAVTEVISKQWYWFQFTWIFSIIISIWHGYALIKKFFGGWGEGCLRDTFFARKRRVVLFCIYTMGILKAGSDSPAAPQPHYKMFKFSIHRYESTFVHCVKTVTATFRSVYRDLVWNPKHLVDYTCRKKNYLYLIQCVENTLPFSPHDQ